LIGVDSQNYPMKYRVKVWNKLALDWKPDHLDTTCTEIELADLPHKIELMLQGKLKGRTILRITD